MARETKNIENSKRKGSRAAQIENARLMRENYMKLRAEGKTNPQIAAMYGIDFSSLYKSLKKIAEANGVTRESLLDNPKKSNSVVKKVSVSKTGATVVTEESIKTDAIVETEESIKTDETVETEESIKIAGTNKIKKSSKFDSSKKKKSLESERVKEMKKNFMKLHNNGYTIAEIADKYHLSSWSVYHHLQEIADTNKVTRDSLLQVVQPTRSSSKLKNSDTGKNNEKVDVIADITAIKSNFGTIEKHIQELIKLVDCAIEKGATDEQ